MEVPTNDMMAFEGRFPLYRLADEESQDVLVTAEDVHGFFVNPEPQSAHVTFVGVHHVGKVKRKVENANLDVMDCRQVKIGEYYVGRIA